MKRGIAIHRDHARDAPRVAPPLALVRHPDVARAQPAGRARLCRLIDRAIGASSLVPTVPLLDVRAFAWTSPLRAHWAEIAREAGAGGGDVTQAAHPVTAAIVGAIPQLHAARFVALPAGFHSPARGLGDRGLGDRGLLTCHLGLVVPREGDLRMALGGRVVRWAEGETLMFDATQAQGWRNDGPQAGLVLSIEVRRPLRQPGRWIADALLRQGARGGAVLARITSR